MDTQAAVRENAETEKASSFDVIVIGAGVAGLYQLYKLRELGGQGRDEYPLLAHRR
jgi:acetone monooxygenase